MRVAIIGASPTGLYTAIALAKRGHHVTVLEKSPAIIGESSKIPNEPLTEGFEPFEISEIGHQALDFISTRRYLLAKGYVDDYVDPLLNVSLSKMFDVKTKSYHYSPLIATRKSLELGFTNFIIKHSKRWPGTIDFNYEAICIGVDVYSGVVAAERCHQSPRSRQNSYDSVEAHYNFNTDSLEHFHDEEEDEDEDDHDNKNQTNDDNTNHEENDVFVCKFDLIIGCDGPESVVRNIGIFQDNEFKATTWESSNLRKNLIQLDDFTLEKGQMHHLSTSSMNCTFAASLPEKIMTSKSLIKKTVPWDTETSMLTDNSTDDADYLMSSPLSSLHSSTSTTDSEMAAGRCDNCQLLLRPLLPPAEDKPKKDIAIIDQHRILIHRNSISKIRQSPRQLQLSKYCAGIGVIYTHGVSDSLFDFTIEDTKTYIDSINPMLRSMITETELKSFAKRPSYIVPPFLFSSKYHLGSHVVLLGSSGFCLQDVGMTISAGLESAMIFCQILLSNQNNVKLSLNQFSTIRHPQLMTLAKKYDETRLAKFLCRSTSVQAQYLDYTAMDWYNISCGIFPRFGSGASNTNVHEPSTMSTDNQVKLLSSTTP